MYHAWERLENDTKLVLESLKRFLGTSRCRWEEYTEMDLIKIG
jgi:hypothetical protein